MDMDNERLAALDTLRAAKRNVEQQKVTLAKAIGDMNEAKHQYTMVCTRQHSAKTLPMTEDEKEALRVTIRDYLLEQNDRLKDAVTRARFDGTRSMIRDAEKNQKWGWAEMRRAMANPAEYIKQNPTHVRQPKANDNVINYPK